jgi:hypothetical protein
MNVVCIVALWFVSIHLPSSSSYVQVSNKLEHRHRHRRCFPPRLRRRSRRRPPLVQLGLPGISRRPTAQCRHRRLGCRRSGDMHHPAIQRGIHIAHLRCGRPLCRRVRTHLLGSDLPHTGHIPDSEMESGQVEQAVPVREHLLEWLGGGGIVFAV